MTDFEDCVRLIPDALLVVDARGDVVVANAKAARLWGVEQHTLHERALSELADETPQKLDECLRLWSRSNTPTPCVLHRRNGDGPKEASAIRIDGARLGSDADCRILLRCRLRSKAQEAFRSLNEKVEALAREVGSRRRMEAELAEQREWLRTTLGSIGDGVIATDEALRVTFLNAVAAKLTGWDPERAQGRHIDEVFRIVDERTGAPANNPCHTALQDGRIVELANHTALVRPDGSMIGIEDTAAPIRDVYQEVTGVVLVFHDVTERRKTEETLRQQREWFETTLGSIGDAVIATDTEGRVTYMNAVAEQLTGWPTDEARGQPSTRVFDIVNETTRKLVESPVTRVLREGVVVGLANHTILIARDGTERPIDDSGAPIRGRDGELIGVVLVFHDITERKEAEWVLRESEQRFRTMADAAPVMIWLADDHGQVTYLNRQWCQLTGEPMESHLGSAWQTALHPDDVDRTVRTFEQAFEQREPFRLEYRLRRHDGEYRWMMVTGAVRYLEDGAFAGYVGSCVDITERRQAEAQLVSINDLLEQRVAERTQQLRKLAAELTQAEQRERRRLAQTLHDHLQQLLAAAKMRVDVLRRQEQPDQQAASVDHVEQLIDQSIEASRSLTVELSPPILYDAGLAPAVPWLARRMRKQHGLEVEAQIDPQAEPTDEDVRVLLFEAVRELLFNTVKHAEIDRAHVHLSLADAATIRLVVTDEGVGFDPRTLDDATSEHGFGLFNIRERLELMGGQMEIESGAEGTRITIEAPMHAAEESPAIAPAPSPVPTNRPTSDEADDRDAVRVLLVDDHKIVREGLVALLSAYEGIDVVGEAGDGLAAMDMARRLHPDVVVMDVSMPRMNGVEATRLISEHLPGVRVVGLSMHQEAELGKAIREAGAVAYLPKDGPVEQLLSIIRNHDGHEDQAD